MPILDKMKGGLMGARVELALASRDAALYGGDVYRPARSCRRKPSTASAEPSVAPAAGSNHGKIAAGPSSRTSGAAADDA